MLVTSEFEFFLVLKTFHSKYVATKRLNCVFKLKIIGLYVNSKFCSIIIAAPVQSSPLNFLNYTTYIKISFYAAGCIFLFHP